DRDPRAQGARDSRVSRHAPPGHVPGVGALARRALRTDPSRGAERTGALAVQARRLARPQTEARCLEGARLLFEVRFRQRVILQPLLADAELALVGMHR